MMHLVGTPSEVHGPSGWGQSVSAALGTLGGAKISPSLMSASGTPGIRLSQLESGPQPGSSSPHTSKDGAYVMIKCKVRRDEGDRN